jgi:hypothetical protein
MERATVKEAKELFGKNFIGKDELVPLMNKMGLNVENISVPEINYSLESLQSLFKDYILILGLPSVGAKDLSINAFRETFGMNPEIQEPCFYSQDWYLKEDFIQSTLENRWYLLKKNVIEESRAVLPDALLRQKMSFPPAILCTYTFFAYYYATEELLWYHDFVWCSDTDHNRDRIYVGKYHDIDGVNKNGFSIHRHLALRNCYAAINSL